MGRLNNINQGQKGFEKTKKNINQDLLKCLKAGRITKEEAMEVGGYETERGVRGQIQLIRLFYPVVATSDHKGYKIIDADTINTKQDIFNSVEELDHAINEFESRIAMMKKNMKPLIAEKNKLIKKAGY